MKIFDKRPLALILSVMLGGFIAFSAQNALTRLFCAVLLFILLFLSSVSHLIRRTRPMIFAISISLLLGILLSYLYFDVYFKIYLHYDNEVEIEGVVTEVSYGQYSNTYTLSTNEINGLKKERQIVIFLDKSESKEIYEGTKISFYATLSAHESDGFDSESYYFARGIAATAEKVTNLKILAQSPPPLSSVFKTMREYLTRHAIMLSDAESGNLVAALLLGERDSLSGQLRLDFTRIGITHILALSGMHLAILSLGLGKLLLLFRIKKKPRLVITLIFTIAYMAFTGFSVSVVRAGIMLILASLLFLISRTKDSITSLTSAVFIICLISPHAIYDMSLWLSALATLGIIVLGEFMGKYTSKKPLPIKFLLYALSSLLSSVFAISATLLITVFKFSGISLIAPISTLIFSVLVEIIMYLGTLMIIFGKILPLGWLLKPLCHFVNELAAALSSYNGIYVSTNYPEFRLAAVAFVIMFYLFIIMDIKHKRAAVSCITAMFAMLFVSAAILSHHNNVGSRLTYTATDKCDEFILNSNGNTALISSAKYSKSLAYFTTDSLKDCKITYLNKYYISHYSYGLERDFEVILRSILVEEIYLPHPQNDDEIDILKKLAASIQGYRTKIKLYAEGGSVKAGNFSILPIYTVPYGEGSSMNAFSITIDEEKYSYLSSGILSENSAIVEKETAQCSAIIFGKHGKKYKDEQYFHYFVDGCKTIILNSENLYLTQQAYISYKENGCSIHLYPSKIGIYSLAD